MLSLVWRAKALDELDDVLAYIAVRNESASEGMRETLEKAALLLTAHPHIGRPGRKRGLREFVAHANYIMVYRVLSDRVEIVSVLHARQEYP